MLATAATTKDVIGPLARYAAGVRFEDLTPTAVYAAKCAIIDTLGAMIAGSSAQGVQALVELAREWGGAEESTILVYGGKKIPAPSAVMANSTMARARELDDCERLGGQHPMVAAVPTALAMAERRGQASGREIITAITVGAEVQSRVARAPKHKVGDAPWTTGFFAPFGAAAAAAKMLGLDEDWMMHALGLAFTEASSTIQSQLDGSLAMRVHHGRAAQQGLICALLAEKGVTGPHNCLEGPAGLYNAHGRGEYDREQVIKGLGQDFTVEHLAVKLFPCCKQIHATTVATLELVKKHDLRPEGVAEILVRVNRNAYNQVCQPDDAVRKPRTVVDAQFSIPFAVGLAVAKRSVLLEDYTEEGIKNPLVLAVAAKVRCMLDPEIDRLGMVGSPGIVEITTVGGQSYKHETTYIRGDPEQPLSFEECVDLKFRNYLSWAVKPIPESAVREVIEMVAGLEGVQDASRMVPSLSA
jgi:2-methylcitrate dehydratase PrpD